MYEQYKFHQEVREYGQDESIYHSGDFPASRWGIDGHLYTISRNKGVSRMLSAFKYYSKDGMCLKMTEDELDCVNFSRVMKGMTELKQSPGCVIIDPTKSGDEYWNYEKYSAQTQDVIHTMDVLEPDHQQLHQFDWSSEHAKSQEGGLMNSSSMNMNYGGKGGKYMRDTEITADCLGEGKVFLYRLKDESRDISWSL